MLLEYYAGTTFAHCADVRAKLLVFTCAIVITFLFGSFYPNLLLAVAAGVLLFSLGMRPSAVAKLLGPLVPIVVLIVVFAAFSAPVPVEETHVLFYAWPGGRLPLTTAGLTHGANLGLRILTMVCLTSTLVLCTPVEDFTTLMQSARLPFPVVFIVVTALRFVPTLQNRSRQILDAQRARGARIEGTGVIGTIRSYTTIMVPLFSTGIRMSEDLAGAMLSRGYGISRQPTQLRTLRMTWRDPLLIICALVVLSAAIVLRMQGVWTR